MNREAVLRRVLWAAAFVNVAGACLFAFPASPAGQLAGLPADVPLTYRALVALFVLLFGGAYAWLAVHRPLIRPFVAFGAMGKAGAFVLIAALYLAGEASWRSVTIMSGDLALAAIFLWGLSRHGLQPQIR